MQRVVAIVAALFLAACTGDADRGSSNAPGLQALRVDEQPRLQLGVLEGETELMFARIVGVVRLADGRIVVADGGSSQLRFFDSSGRFLRSAGRAGQGPGEFEYLFDLRRCGTDHLFVFELPWNANRFSFEGAFVDSVDLDSKETGGVYEFACNRNGEFLTIGWGAPRMGRGFFRSRGRVAVLGTTGEPIADLGEFPVSERHGFEGGTGPHPYGKQTVLALTSSSAYIGTADEHSLLRIPVGGGSSTTISLQDGAPPLELTPELVSRYREWMLDHAESDWRTWWEQELRTLEFPPTLPAYTQLVIDPEGLLWVKDFKHEWDVVERWRVYTDEGALLAGLELPVGFRIHEIGADHVLGVWTDELGTEYVRLYGLTRERVGG